MFRAPRHVLSPRRVALLAAFVAATGCTLNTDVTGPAAIIKNGGDGQTQTTNTALLSPLSVTVVNQFGQLLPNITVSWTIVSGGGALGAAQTLTDDSGIASVTYTTGATAGSVVIQAKVSGIPPLTFGVTVT
jgi:Big-like domain-containing protein